MTTLDRRSAWVLCWGAGIKTRRRTRQTDRNQTVKRQFLKHPWVKRAPWPRALWLALFGALLAAPAATTALADTFKGSVTHVRDGDIIVVDDQPVKIYGITTPERFKPGGREARNYMRKLVFGKPVTCRHEGLVIKNQLIAVCSLAKADIGMMIIRAGHARDCTRASGHPYFEAEIAARKDGFDLSKSYPLPTSCQVE